MWFIKIDDVKQQERDYLPEGNKHVTIGDETGSIIFIATPTGVEKMKELVEQANSFILNVTETSA
jgi:hypothetical protein